MKSSTVKALFLVFFVAALFSGTSLCQAAESSKDRLLEISVDKYGNVTQLMSTNWGGNVLIVIAAPVFKALRMSDIFVAGIFLNKQPSFVLRAIAGALNRGKKPPRLEVKFYSIPADANPYSEDCEWSDYRITGLASPSEWGIPDHVDKDLKDTTLYQTFAVSPVKWNAAVITLAR